jgi:hypothetical protein
MAISLASRFLLESVEETGRDDGLYEYQEQFRHHYRLIIVVSSDSRLAL